MSYLIAVSGKGGVGKTTISAILVRELIARGCGPVLAVDADPNTCLDAALGVVVASTVGRLREEARQAAGAGMPEGVSKQELLELKIAESLVEQKDFDLIAMGRPEGPGCYCYANNVLKNALAKLSAQYRFVLVDNEAGLENMSRRIVLRANLLVFVTDPSRRGLDTVRRLRQLAAEMGVQYDHLAIVVNRLRTEELSGAAQDLKAETGADFIIGAPDNSELAGLSERGKSLLELSPSNPVASAVSALLDKMKIGGNTMRI